MAEHELNKIVDDSGEVFNLRDSTKQPTADRVTAWGSTPSDTHYPSEKLVKNALDGKLPLYKLGSEVPSSQDFVCVRIKADYVSGVNKSQVLLFDITSFADGTIVNNDGAYVGFKGFFIGGKPQGGGEAVCVKICAKIAYTQITTTMGYNTLKSDSIDCGPEVIKRTENGVDKYYLSIFYGASVYSGNCILVGQFLWRKPTSIDDYSYKNGLICEYTPNETYPAGEPYWNRLHTFTSNIHANTSTKLATARKLKTNLARTADSTFDGSADQENIPVTGALPLGNGGTGKTTAKAAEYNLTTGKSEISDTTSGDDRVVFELASPSESNGVTRGFRKLSTIWTWIKGLLSSESGVNISGNAATATALSAGADRTKLDGIAEGAEVNVQSDWNQSTTTADDYIKNKPTLGTAASKNVATSGNASTSQVVMGNDTRLTDSRTPTSHASSATTYGVGTTSNYGHVKLATGDMNGATHADGVAVSKNHTHSQYLTSHQSIAGKMNTSGDNAVAPSGNGGNGATATLLNNLTGPNNLDPISSDDVCIPTTISDGSDQTKWYKRPVSKLWSYIKGKMTSDSGVNISGTAEWAKYAYYTYYGDGGSAYWIKIGRIYSAASSGSAGGALTALISTGYNSGTQLSAQLIKLTIRSKGTSVSGVDIVGENVTLGLRNGLTDADVKFAVHTVTERTTSVGGIYDIYVQKNSWHRVDVLVLHNDAVSMTYNSDTTKAISDVTNMTIFSPTLPYAGSASSATTATDYNTSSGTIKTALDDKLKKDGSNNVSNSDGSGTASTLLHSLKPGMANIISDNVYFVTTSSDGTQDGKWWKRKASEIWPWITSHTKTRILKDNDEVYWGVGADSNHSIILDYDGSGSSPTMGLWVRWGSGSNAKWMAECDSSGNCTFNGDADTVDGFHISVGSYGSNANTIYFY